MPPKRDASAQNPRRRQSTRPEYQLLAAVILQALSDAQGGDAEAIDFMDNCAPEVAATWLGIDARLIARWREIDAGWPSTSPVFRKALLESSSFWQNLRRRAGRRKR